VFTEKYLRIEPTQMSDDHGYIAITIGDNDPSSWIKFIPSQDMRDFASEMLINTRELNKFNLQIGGQINLKEAFFLLNNESNQMYYFHVNEEKCAGSAGVGTVLELNAGMRPTRLKAKLFLPAMQHPEHIEALKEPANLAGNDKDKRKDLKVINSGDTVRLFHKDAGGFIQSSERYSGNRQMFPVYPDFLQRQIKTIN